MTNQLQSSTSVYAYTRKTADTGTRNDKLKKVLLTCGMILAVILAYAQETGTYCLKVKLRPTVDGTAIKGATVKVYKGAAEESVIEVTKSKEVVLLLERNDSYTIQVSAPGRHARSVVINTSVPEALPADMRFKCVMDIELPSAFGLQNEYYQDFPVAIVKFDPDAVRFGHIEDYTATVKAKMEEEPSGEYMIATEPLEGEVPPAEAIAKTEE